MAPYLTIHPFGSLPLKEGKEVLFCHNKADYAPIEFFFEARR
jgi:hypothetical protein